MSIPASCLNAGCLFALEELLPLFVISNAMCDQSAAELFKPTSGKDSSARVRREQYELVPPCPAQSAPSHPGDPWGQGSHEEEKH